PERLFRDRCRARSVRRGRRCRSSPRARDRHRRGRRGLTVFWIVSGAVRHRVATALVALLVLIAGAYDARRVPLDVFPEFVPVQVEIQTEAPGFSPQQVEELVTRPIEAALNGAQDLSAMRSESIPGLSVISLNFADAADPHLARQP